MKKLIKISLVSFLVILVALIVIPFLFKGKIIQKIKDETNNTLNADFNFDEKELSLSLIKSFPNLNIEIEKLSIVGRDSFKGDTLVYLPKVSLSVNVMSAIRGEQIKINKIELNQPQINLLVLKSGRANWDIAKPDTTNIDTTESFFDIGLKKLEIENGNLLYNDESLGFMTRLKNFNHTLSGDFTQDNFLLKTNTDAQEFTLAYGGVNYIHEVASTIKANIDMDMKNMKFTFKDNDILLNELNLGGEGFVDMNDNDMDFDLVFNTKKTDFKTILSLVPGVFTKDFNKAKASGKLALSGYFKGKMTDDLMPGFGLKLDIDNGFFQYPDLPKSLSQIFVNLEVDNKTGNPDHTIINLSRFDANIAGEPIYAQVLAKTPESNPYVKGKVKGTINLDEFRSFIPLEKTTEISGIIKSDIAFDGFVNAIEKQDFSKFNANGIFNITNFKYKDPENLKQGTQFNANLTLNPKNINVESFEGKVGMSDFALKGTLDNLLGYMMKDELLKGAFTFNSNYFNANEFLTEEEVVKEPQASDTLSLQAFDVPSNLDFKLNSSIKQLVYDNLNMTNLVGGIIIKEQQLYLDKVGVNLFGGTLGLNGVYNSTNPKFPFSKMDMSIKSLDIIKTFQHFEMVKQLAPIAQFTQGLFNANVDLSNNYNPDLSVNYPTVSGLIQLGIADAAVKNLPILNMIADQLKIEKLKNLSLKNLNFKLNILNGKVMLDSLKLPLWTGANAKISGYSALDQSLKYVAKLSIPRKDFGIANTALNSLTAQAQQKGVNLKVSDIVDVDVIIGGFFSKPEIKVNLSDAKKNIVDNLKNQLKDEAEAKKQAAIDEAKRRAEIQKQKAIDSLNRLKQQGVDKLNAEKKALEQKALDEKQKAEEKAKAEIEKQKQEAARKLEEEKQKAKDKLKKGLGF